MTTKNLATLRAFLGRGINAVDTYLKHEAMNGTKEQLENDLGMLMAAIVLVTESCGLNEENIVRSAETQVDDWSSEGDSA